MIEIRKYRVSLSTIILLLTIVFGNVAITEVRIMGVVPTYYRVIIPIIFIICTFWNKKIPSAIIIADGSCCSANKPFFIMGAAWLLYGFVSMFISPWSDIATGAKELIGIFLGILSVYSLITLCLRGQFNSIMNILKLILAAMIIIGYIELFTGWHMRTSMLSDPQYLEMIQKSYPDVDISTFSRNIATGIFYNPNDYCAFLTIMSPILLYYKKIYNITIKVLHIIGSGILFMLLLLNDSFICIISFLIGNIFYLIVSKASLKKWLSFIVIIGVVYIWGGVTINSIFQLLFEDTEIKMAKLYASLNSQMANMTNGTGSLMYRINTYTESVSEMLAQSKGLGLGAGSFTSYFSVVSDKLKMMANPHSLWIEILSQYGVIIFSIVVATFVYIFIKLYKMWRKTNGDQFIVIMAMGVCFIFASFAPSSFLKGTYYWIIFGLALGALSTIDLYLISEKKKIKRSKL